MHLNYTKPTNSPISDLVNQCFYIPFNVHSNLQLNAANCIGQFSLELFVTNQQRIQGGLRGRKTPLGHGGGLRPPCVCGKYYGVKTCILNIGLHRIKYRPTLELVSM